MLPAGLTADLASSSPRAALQRLHPSARTVARLLVGACSCDLVRPRLANPIEDERELRARYHGWKLSRSEIIKELERHRRGPLPRPSPTPRWSAALSGFVVEHARNAGPTLYLLEFAPSMREQPSIASAPMIRRVREVDSQSVAWLAEGQPVVVS